MATIPRYILVESASLEPTQGEGLCLVDHHRAHARIIYEKLVQLKTHQHPQTTTSSQLLLIPYTFDTTPTQSEILLKQISILNAMGISLKPFGPNTFNVDAIPHFFGNVDVQEFCKSLIQQLDDSPSESFERESSRKIAMAASRAAVSKTKKLSLEEAQGLIKQWSDCQNRYHCPQGRPIVAHLTLDELARYFK